MDLDKLEALAQAATEGPWQVWDAYPLAKSGGEEVGALRIGTETADVLYTNSLFGADICGRAADFEYIAEADPQTVLQLIAALREADRALAAYGAGDEALLDLMDGGT